MFYAPPFIRSHTVLDPDLQPEPIAAATHHASSDAGGVLRELSIASFGGSGQNSIQAFATDPSGNLYVTGTTSSADFPVRNAYQSSFGEALLLRTTDWGNTWTRMASPPDLSAVFPDPVVPQVLLAGGTAVFTKARTAAKPGRWFIPLRREPRLIR